MLKNILFNINKKINYIINNINSNKKITIFIEKIKYFVKNFKYSIILVFFAFVIFKIKNVYNYNFGVDNITDIVSNSNFVSNAIAINSNNFITTYKSIKDTCKTENEKEKIRLFLVSKNSMFEVFIKNKNEYIDLAILGIKNNYTNSIKLNNFVLFPRKNDIKQDEKVFVSRTVNDLTYLYKTFKLKENKKTSAKYVKIDNFRKNFGEVVLNKNLEFVGITSSLNKKKFGLFKENEIITLDIVKHYLRENGVYYFVNIKNSDLYNIKNYTNNINYKLVCQIEKVQIPRVFKIYH